MSEHVAIIVAGGLGTRFGASTPKQLALLNGKPLLLYSLEAFYAFHSSIHLILVLHESIFDTWNLFISQYNIHIPHQIVAGGNTRFHSVKNGIDACSSITDDALVAIHDAARPLISTQIIEIGFRLVATHHAAVPVVPVNESLRKITDHINEPIPRHQYYLVQTPQFFRMSILRSAYQISYRPDFTDDASVVQSIGHHIHTFQGDPYNIKITHPLDVHIASAIITYKKK